jgi:hypothetical protein
MKKEEEISKRKMQIFMAQQSSEAKEERER